MRGPAPVNSSSPQASNSLPDKVNRIIDQQLLAEAYLSQDDFGIVCSVVKTKFKGTLAERQEYLNISIDSFFKTKTGISITTDNFDSKPPSLHSAPPQALSTLLFYGIDFISDQDFEQLLSSRCQVHFSSPHKLINVSNSCLRVTYSNKNEARFVFKALTGNQSHQSQEWIEISPYSFYGIERVMLVRYAQLDELLLSLKDKQRKYYEFKQSIPELKYHLLSKFKAFKDYNIIKGKIYFERNSKRFFNNT